MLPGVRARRGVSFPLRRDLPNSRLCHPASLCPRSGGRSSHNPAAFETARRNSRRAFTPSVASSRTLWWSTSPYPCAIRVRNPAAPRSASVVLGSMERVGRSWFDESALGQHVESGRGVLGRSETIVSDPVSGEVDTFLNGQEQVECREVPTRGIAGEILAASRQNRLRVIQPGRCAGHLSSRDVTPDHHPPASSSGPPRPRVSVAPEAPNPTNRPLHGHGNRSTREVSAPRAPCRRERSRIEVAAGRRRERPIRLPG